MDASEILLILLKKQFIESLSTRELLSMRDECYRCQHDHYFIDKCQISGTSISGLSLAEIKGELARRPHIPNKQESIEIRKQRKKDGPKKKTYNNRVI